jgi:hypothetical protein
VAGKRSISVAELKAECTVLERAVRSAGLATIEEVQSNKPGKPDNPDRDARAWLRYYTALQRAHALVTKTSLPSSPADDATVLDALRGEPVEVPLIRKGERVWVHPKSLNAALYVHALDLKLAWLMSQKATLEKRGTAGDVLMLQSVYEAISYVYQLLCWIVCTEGPTMPFDSTELDPRPPEWIVALEPWDVVRICQAHQKLMLRLHALSALIDEESQHEENGTRPSWSMFYSTMAVELKESAVNLIKLRSVGEMLAMARMNAAAHAVPKKNRAEETEVVR